MEAGFWAEVCVEAACGGPVCREGVCVEGIRGEVGVMLLLR